MHFSGYTQKTILIRKITLIAICTVMLPLFFSGCTGGVSHKHSQKLQVITTIFPIYDWVRELTRNVPQIEVSWLMKAGSDMHNFQPSVSDLVELSSCDLFVYVGGESDNWVEDALSEAENDRMITVNLMEVLEAKEEEAVHGIKEGESEEDGDEYDEHVWLSLRNAAVYCRHIAEALAKVDSKNADTYYENCRKYCEGLSELDKRYASDFSSAPRKTLLFADRFPFRYLVDDYGFEYYAAFSGCTSDTEASFDTIIRLAKILDKLQLKEVIIIDDSSEKMARTIINSTKDPNKAIVRLNSMQNVTGGDVDLGCTYLDIMKENLEVIKSLEGRE